MEIPDYPDESELWDEQWLIIDSSDHKYEMIRSKEKTFVLKVYGGWLVRTVIWCSDQTENISSTMCFVPDPNHEWKIE